MSTTSNGRRTTRSSATDMKDSGGGCWLTGECSHSWWAPDGMAAIGHDTKSYGRMCPECKTKVQVRQGRPRRACACGAVLSAYNRDQTRCGPCLRSDRG